jgi:hypothetical protein
MFRDQFSRLGSSLLRTLGLLAMVLMLSLLATNRAQAQNPVIGWDAIASTTIVTNAHEPPAVAAVWFAYVHLAVYDAVNAIDQQHQPYLFTTDAPAGASEDAAAIAAAHRVLVHYFPAQQTTLDGQFTTSIAALTDTPASIAAGEAVGESAAQALIAARANDGLLANVPYTPPVGPGFWQPTPPLFGPPLAPWLGQMVPFTMTSAAQFFPHDGPDRLQSKRWIDDYTETMSLGALNSTVRTSEQTEIGLFWTEHPNQQYARAFRGLAIQEGLDTADTARLMAMLTAGLADGAIGCFNAKYTYSFWRPVTAIPAGGGNSKLTADLGWTPLGSTPSHPEYPAAHGCVTGAVAAILEGYFGTPNVRFSVDSLVTNTTHVFNNTDDLINEVKNARIYAGFHYRHSVDDGARLGQRVAEQLLKQFFKPVKQHN